MINILTGRQTDPIQETILDQAIESYLNNKNKEVFIIVPNHIKFTTEVRSLTKLANFTKQKQVAVKNLQILSFSRLAWFFLRNEKIILPEILDDSASIMLLKQIVNKRQQELQIFNSKQANYGSLNQLYKAILSVRQGNLDLDTVSNKTLDGETSRKIHDIKIIYDDFIEALANKFATKDEMQLLLNQYLVNNKNINSAEFYFTDFSHFSLQELMTIRLLSKKAAGITCAFKTKNGKINRNMQAGDYDYIVQNTIKQLESFWQNQNLNYQTKEFPLVKNMTNAAKLNAIWTKTIPAKNQDLSSYLQLVKADSRYAEAYFVARTIYQQVVLNNYRYRDFLVLTPNLSEYETYLSPILRQNEIPFFNDLQKQMKFHPLVLVIENLNELLKRNFETKNILAIMKSRLLIPDWYHDEQEYQKDVDNLENFVLAHGINYDLWHKNFNYFIDAKLINIDNSKKIIEKLEKLRNFFVSQIDQLFTNLKKQVDPKIALEIFWDFLISNNVAKRLDIWRDKANLIGDLQAEQEPEQVWSNLNSLLKDYLLIAKEFDIYDFFSLLISGFSEANFSQIPSTTDAVNISEMGMVQSPGYKQVFIIGATSNNLPQIEKIPGFFSSENIEQLKENFKDNAYLEDQHQINNLDQQYQFGNALSLATDKIYLSYPVLNTSNEQLTASIYYRQLLDYVKIPEFFQHDLPKDDHDILFFITNPKASLGYLSYLNKANFNIDSLLGLSREKNLELTDQVLKAIKFKNIPELLEPELAQQLYGQNLSTSVSQLETFYANPYEYFLNYGLKLRKRFENELDAIQAGNYYHETFDLLVKKLNLQNLTLSEIDTDELEIQLSEIQAKMKTEGKYRQLLNDPFNRYLFNRLDQTTRRVALNWKNNLTKTGLNPAYSELSFGKNDKVKGLSFDIDNHHIDLRGKIDRLDLFESENFVLSQIIDYKSSSKKFDPAFFANGITLQMTSYLEVIKNNADLFTKKNKNFDLLGAFYQTVTQATEKLNSTKMIQSDFVIKDVLKESLKGLQYNGILISDPGLFETAEPSLIKNQLISDLYSGVKKKTNGDFTFPSKTSYSPKQFESIIKYNSYLIKNAAKNIFAGNIELSPYLYQKRTPIQYSDYKDIFFFDAMLPENNYKKIKNISKKELLDIIKDRMELD